MTRALGLIVAAAALVLGLFALREATLTTHPADDLTGSTTVTMELEAQLEQMPEGTSLAGIARALTATCLLEVEGRAPGGPTATGPATFVVVIAPSLDRSDEKQLRGCLEDWQVDHVRTDVVDVTADTAAAAPAAAP